MSTDSKDNGQDPDPAETGDTAGRTASAPSESQTSLPTANPSRRLTIRISPLPRLVIRLPARCKVRSRQPSGVLQEPPQKRARKDTVPLLSPTSAPLPDTEAMTIQITNSPSETNSQNSCASVIAAMERLDLDDRPESLSGSEAGWESNSTESGGVSTDSDSDRSVWESDFEPSVDDEGHVVMGRDQDKREVEGCSRDGRDAGLAKMQSMLNAEEVAEEVRTICARRGVVAKVGREEVRDRDIATLLPGKWLNDEVVNFYGALLVNRSKESVVANRIGMLAGLKIYVFSTFFWPKLHNEGYTRSRLSKWTDNVSSQFSFQRLMHETYFI